MLMAILLMKMLMAMLMAVLMAIIDGNVIDGNVDGKEIWTHLFSIFVILMAMLVMTNEMTMMTMPS